MQLSLRTLARRIFPFLEWRPALTGRNLRADLVAGLTVALVAIPQSLAYAQLAGLPAYYGLYAALLPTIVGALFGSSAQLSTGPVALTSLLTAASIAPLAVAGGEQYVLYAITLALLSGLLQVAFGLMRLGVLLNLLSHPVLMGFVNAAAILITLSQIPSLFGMERPESRHALLGAWQVLVALPQAHGYSVAFGAAAIVLLAALARFAPRWPGVLVTVVLLTAASYGWDYAASGGRIVGEIPRGLPTLQLPPFDLQSWIALAPAAFVIAVISFMEAMSSAKIAALKTATPWDENRELIGQGLAKIAAALNQTMPVSGSFSRSALNLAAGARSGVSSIVCALFVLLTLLFFTPLLRYLPLPVLAAIIVVALARLIDVRSLVNAWRASREDALAAALTFVSTIAFAPNIQIGIFVGIITSLALFVYGRMRPNLEVIEPASESLARELPGEAHPGLARALGVIRFDASLVFVNATYFESAAMLLERRHPQLRFILVSASAINALDASGVHMLSSLAEGLAKKGIALAFSGVKPHVRRVLQRTGLEDKIGAAGFFATDHDAMLGLGERVARQALAAAG
jgi:SulP family sulfate permease